MPQVDMIKPNEFHVLNDIYVIRTSLPLEKVTPDKIKVQCRNWNLDAGRTVTVQVMNNHYDTLFFQGEFTITRRQEKTVTEQTDWGSQQKQITEMDLQQTAPWRATRHAPPGSVISVEGVDSGPETPSAPSAKPGVARYEWQIGRKAYVVYGADGVEIGQTPDKDMAMAMVSGAEEESKAA